jgi:hypothetical protein
METIFGIIANEHFGLWSMIILLFISGFVLPRISLQWTFIYFGTILVLAVLEYTSVAPDSTYFTALLGMSCIFYLAYTLGYIIVAIPKRIIKTFKLNNKKKVQDFSYDLVSEEELNCLKITKKAIEPGEYS